MVNKLSDAELGNGDVMFRLRAVLDAELSSSRQTDSHMRLDLAKFRKTRAASI
jgi:hypothetical protein